MAFEAISSVSTDRIFSTVGVNDGMNTRNVTSVYLLVCDYNIHNMKYMSIVI